MERYFGCDQKAGCQNLFVCLHQIFLNETLSSIYCRGPDWKEAPVH